MLVAPKLAVILSMRTQGSPPFGKDSANLSYLTGLMAQTEHADSPASLIFRFLMHVHLSGKTSRQSFDYQIQ